MSYIFLSTTPIVKGYVRSTINDFQRDEIHFLPSNIANYILTNNYIINKNEFFKIVPNKKKELIYYFHYLLNNEIIFNVKNPNNFIKLPLKWSHPSSITNSIIIFKNERFDYSKFKSIINYLDGINCHFIEIRFYIKLSFHKIKKIISFINKSKIISFHLILSNNFYEDNFLRKIIELSPKLIDIKIFNSHKNEVNNIRIYNFNIIISYKSKTIIKQELTPLVSLSNMNIKTYIESQKCNLYFNRKLIIDESGNIMLTPFKKEIYGNILNRTKMIHNKSINFFWNIHKELLDICNVCEFRHMCIDSRIPYKRNDGSWYYDSECNYNPYIAKWKGDKGYKTLSECGIEVNRYGLNINNIILEKIQEELWL